MRAFKLAVCLFFIWQVSFAQGVSDSTDFSDTKQIIDMLSDDNAIEYAPSISADGKTIIFETNKSGSYKLYESKKDESGNWTPPLPIKNINNFGDSTDLIGGPSISFDGNILYFFGSIGFGSREDIYYSLREKDGWSVPESIGAPINTNGYEGFPSISADGKTLFFVKENTDGPQSRDLRRTTTFCYSIYKSVKKTDGSWAQPEKLPYPINFDCEKAPKIMADSRTLIFSSNRPGGLGDYDMYQSKLTPLGDWSNPVPLTFANSSQSDQLPTISAEGDLMYFIYNNQDIYSVIIPPELRQFANNIVQGNIIDADTKEGISAKVIVKDALTSDIITEVDNNPEDGRYTVIVPIGKYYNIEVKKDGYSDYIKSLDLRKVTTYQETDLNIELFQNVFLDISVSDHDLFEGIVSEVGVKIQGHQEFFQKLKTQPDGQVTATLPIGSNYEFYVSAQNFKSAFFSLDLSKLVLYRDFEKELTLEPEKKQVFINIADLSNNSKVKSKIVLRNKDRDERIEVDGNSMVSLRVGDRYEIEATSDQGYAFNSTTIDVSKGMQEQVQMKLQKLETDAKLTLRDINFETNSAVISDVSFTELNRVIKLMKENPGLKVEIAAHTDDVGSDVYNAKLSDKRAESVVGFLIENEIDSERFVAKGYGESSPKVSNENEENRALNRRVELKILGI